MRSTTSRLAGIAGLFAGMLTCAVAQPSVSPAEVGSFAPAETASDLIREAAGSDVAFIAAGSLRRPTTANDLADYMQFPNDTISVVRLTGAQILEALERSIAFFPSPNAAFLQVSGLEIVYRSSPSASPRIADVRVGNGAIQRSASYTVAMPTALARGSYGYFRIWDRDAIEETLPGVTLGSLLRGQQPRNIRPRWESER